MFDKIKSLVNFHRILLIGHGRTGLCISKEGLITRLKIHFSPSEYEVGEYVDILVALKLIIRVDKGFKVMNNTIDENDIEYYFPLIDDH